MVPAIFKAVYNTSDAVKYPSGRRCNIVRLCKDKNDPYLVKVNATEEAPCWLLEFPDGERMFGLFEEVSLATEEDITTKESEDKNELNIQWFDCKEVPLPSKSGDNPFWITLEIRGIKMVLMAFISDDGHIEETNDINCESVVPFSNIHDGKITHWQPINIPKYPATKKD